MKYLIVGLGNPGMEYVATRHNIGFRILDALSEASNTAFESGRYGWIARGRVKSAQLVMLKPSTYMNLSGDAVRYWVEKEKIDLQNMLVCVDDVALPFGTIRLRAGGSDAGHNGLKDIASKLMTTQYPRLRFGIGHEFSRGSQIDYVLGHFTPDEEEQLPKLIETAVDAIKCFCLEGIGRAMTQFNRK